MKNDRTILLSFILWCVFTAVILLITSCKPTPQFYINGKPYYVTRGRCIKEELTVHYYGPVLQNECVEWKMDTIEIKADTREWP